MARLRSSPKSPCCDHRRDTARRSHAERAHSLSLDRDGKLDDPDYIASLSPADRERYARRNVFAFSLSIAAHEVLQLVGLVARMPRVGGVGPQHYQAYPGVMTSRPHRPARRTATSLPLPRPLPTSWALLYSQLDGEPAQSFMHAQGRLRRGIARRVAVPGA